MDKSILATYVYTLYTSLKNSIEKLYSSSPQIKKDILTNRYFMPDYKNEYVKEFIKKKRTGGIRRIYEPSGELKEVLVNFDLFMKSIWLFDNNYNYVIMRKDDEEDDVTSYIEKYKYIKYKNNTAFILSTRGSSVAGFEKMIEDYFLSKNPDDYLIIKTDVKDFFTSVRYDVMANIFKTVYSDLYNNFSELTAQIGITPLEDFLSVISDALALSFYKGSLPQGFPTSPLLSYYYIIGNKLLCSETFSLKLAKLSARDKDKYNRDDSFYICNKIPISLTTRQKLDYIIDTICTKKADLNKEIIKVRIEDIVTRYASDIFLNVILQYPINKLVHLKKDPKADTNRLSCTFSIVNYVDDVLFIMNNVLIREVRKWQSRKEYMKALSGDIKNSIGIGLDRDLVNMVYSAIMYKLTDVLMYFYFNPVDVLNKKSLSRPMVINSYKINATVNVLSYPEIADLFLKCFVKVKEKYDNTTDTNEKNVYLSLLYRFLLIDELYVSLYDAESILQEYNFLKYSDLYKQYKEKYLALSDFYPELDKSIYLDKSTGTVEKLAKELEDMLYKDDIDAYMIRIIGLDKIGQVIKLYGNSYVKEENGILYYDGVPAFSHRKTRVMFFKTLKKVLGMIWMKNGKLSPAKYKSYREQIFQILKKIKEKPLTKQEINIIIKMDVKDYIKQIDGYFSYAEELKSVSDRRAFKEFKDMYNKFKEYVASLEEVEQKQGGSI